MSTMLYKAGGTSKIWGKNLQTKLVTDDEVDSSIADGWHRHPHDVPNETGGVDDDQEDMGEVSDGYHTFNELYAHRVRLFSTLMHCFPKSAWWSRKHSDGEVWDGWILAGIATPEGEVTYHLPESEIANLPEATEIETGKEWDGHSADDVLDRLLSLRLPSAETKRNKSSKKNEPQKEVSDEPDNQG